MVPEVQFKHQRRRTLAMKVTPGGVVVLLPRGMDTSNPQVQDFVQAGLQKLETPKASETAELSAQDVQALVADWAERIGVKVGRLQVRAMRRKWASCSSQGTLTLSRDVLLLPRDLVEYVACHELLHLRVPEHSKGWQTMMGIYLPDWRDRERRLAGWVMRRGPHL